ncbi:MAG: hypothetical protein QOG55_541 [Acidobacteriaceae bacterium]|nr:hypothetical protein [Acidobacteriaceae bacterium]
MQDAVRVNRISVRNRLHPEDRRYRPGETAITVLQPGHFVLADVFLPLLLIVIQAHAKNH